MLAQCWPGSLARCPGDRSHAGCRGGRSAKAYSDDRPPDPNTRIPEFKLPANSSDTHCHIFGPASRYPFCANRPYNPPDAPLADVPRVARKNRRRTRVIVNATVHGTDNRVVTDAIAKSDGKYQGIANVNDEMSDKDLERLDKGGIRGCRFAFLKRFGGVGDMGGSNASSHRVAESAGMSMSISNPGPSASSRRS